MSARVNRYNYRQRRRMSRRTKIVPIILAAGPARTLPWPKALAPFGRKTALQIALENCAGLGTPVVVLGHRAAEIRPTVPPRARVVVNRAWRRGQLGSLLAGLRRLRPGVAFMLYPVDYPLLQPATLRRLAAGFNARSRHQTIVAPIFRGRQGHPVIFSAALRVELRRARTAKEMVARDRRRVKLVPVGTPAIWRDFSSPVSYRRRRRDYERRSGRDR